VRACVRVSAMLHGSAQNRSDKGRTAFAVHFVAQDCQMLPGAASVASFLAAVLAEICLCNVCPDQEILRRHGHAARRGEARPHALPPPPQLSKALSRPVTTCRRASRVCPKFSRKMYVCATEAS
jgi:hypothetical protein